MAHRAKRSQKQTGIAGALIASLSHATGPSLPQRQAAAPASAARPPSTSSAGSTGRASPAAAPSNPPATAAAAAPEEPEETRELRRRVQVRLQPSLKRPALESNSSSAELCRRRRTQILEALLLTVNIVVCADMDRSLPNNSVSCHHCCGCTGLECWPVAFTAAHAVPNLVQSLSMRYANANLT